MLDVNRIYYADCFDILSEIEDNSIDAIITDPPYELGFMGKKWDKTGIANNVEMWKECLRVLKPGGYLLSFGGTRTYHRMACAIEDAGFEIRDMIEWVYGSGFPKSHNIGKAVDKRQGNKREIGGLKYRNGKTAGGNRIGQLKGGLECYASKGHSEWEGWGTALKPAHEPICMAMKPREGTFVNNVLKWGVGGLNIDVSRVEIDKSKETDNRLITGKNNISNGKHSGGVNIAPDGNGNPMYKEKGRFPANLIHDNSEEVRECFPESKSSGAIKRNKVKIGINGIYNEYKAQDSFGFDDSGNASRYFKSIVYNAKASKKDRGKDNTHPTVKPTALIEYLIAMVSIENAIILDPFLGSGTTAVAAKKLNRKYIGIEKEKKYFEIAKKRLAKPSQIEVKI
jgi:site-specific DNA-methyltransferase (adenine-specific)